MKYENGPLLPTFTKIKDTYTIVGFLGKGAFGEVYRVRHRYLGVQALKVFRLSESSTKKEEELLSEGYLLSKITHHNIVRVFEANIFEFDGKKLGYIVMEEVKGETLASLMERLVKLNLTVSLDLHIGICSGLEQAHKIQPPIIHRDVKPANILLQMEGTEMIPKVSDFGLARHVDPVTRLASAGGTLLYMAPEAFWGYESTASDVFSAGIILYLMLTGVSPFAVPKEFTSLTDAKKKDVFLVSRSKSSPPPSKYNSDINEQLDAVVLKSLEYDSKKRFSDAGEFLFALNEFRKNKK